jgi:hypothetical protein
VLRGECGCSSHSKADFLYSVRISDCKRINLTFGEFAGHDDHVNSALTLKEQTS